jgi:hypothetical protein
MCIRILKQKFALFETQGRGGAYIPGDIDRSLANNESIMVPLSNAIRWALTKTDS